ncbi:methylation-associated defense system DNA methyltransferase MAD2 [Pseudomonas syringae]|uniref:methylation-associated defense system DNA methyltransferase MAD2 n=1 Tax=Pseudomonas syringae TaxID=317 RepID=UPI00200A5F68|nr:N-6 DNA methylase [Pseudomonas syringae]MCK9698679.1 N-6 DNA methylase [Pseudomonas syringae pv. syringae]MCK9728351.1 N-6 DNA methylase [Pseudomonas syringae pv. syringae]MDU8417069.1 N-6 DNA methylase [Pseudomonas syringae]
MPEQRSIQDSNNMSDFDQELQVPERMLEEGKVFDYITGNPVKDSDKEKVRQRISRAIIHEYGIAAEDMEPDFKIKVLGKNRKLDIAIFKPGRAHTVDNLCRAVVVDKEPKVGTKGAYRMRDPEEASKEFELLEAVMAEVDSCEYSLWTNGLEFFFFKKEVTRFDTKFKSIGDWPLGDDTFSVEGRSTGRMRRADPVMLRTAFRRCHNYIHGNEGMPKDAAFWQFLYLIFCKMYDEQQPNEARGFYVGPYEPFDPEGQKSIRLRIKPLFERVKKKYDGLFKGNEEITLSDRALAFIVSELARYDFGRTDVDAKGAAYQEIVGTNLRGDRGQYFTPRGAISLVVKMLAPKEHERVFDSSCGTGGFLVETLNYLSKVFHEEKHIKVGDEDTEEFISIRDRLANFAAKNLFGADFDPFLVRAAQMNVMMAGNSLGHLYHMNSLEFPLGHLPGVQAAREAIRLGTIDVLMTNPPFGSDIPVTEKTILEQYELARRWERQGDGYVMTNTIKPAVSPEVLFVERCVKWLKPGGRAGIVLPDGILGNPGDEYIRYWILRHCWVLASVDLPVESFIVEANVNILTSLLFLKRKPDEVIQAEDLGQIQDYPVFMAVADKVGFDRRGNTLYKRQPDGEEILVDVSHEEKVRIGGGLQVRTLHRKERILDDDLPEIAKAYAEFRAKYPEPS